MPASEKGGGSFQVVSSKLELSPIGMSVMEIWNYIQILYLLEFIGWPNWQLVDDSVDQTKKKSVVKRPEFKFARQPPPLNSIPVLIFYGTEYGFSQVT